MEVGTLSGLAGESRGEVVLEPGPEYRDGVPVRVHVVKRERRYDIADAGEAVRLAGAPAGWLEVAEAVVAADALNVNRRGVVFVDRVVEGRDVTGLAARVAATSSRLYAELLDLGEE